MRSHGVARSRSIPTRLLSTQTHELDADRPLLRERRRRHLARHPRPRPADAVGRDVHRKHSPSTGRASRARAAASSRSGFLPGDRIHVGGGTPYDGDYTAYAVTATVLTLTATIYAANDARTGVRSRASSRWASTTSSPAGDIDLLLRPSMSQSGSGTAGGSSSPTRREPDTYYTFFHPTAPAPSLSTAAPSARAHHDRQHVRLPRLDVGGRPVAAGADRHGQRLHPDRELVLRVGRRKPSSINILGITEITGAEDRLRRRAHERLHRRGHAVRGVHGRPAGRPHLVRRSPTSCSPRRRRSSTSWTTTASASTPTSPA